MKDADPTQRHGPTALERTVVGAYRLHEHLGSGGFASVYRGEHVDTGQIVALKVLTATLAPGVRPRERFDREIRAVRAMSHPNIVTLVDAGVLPDQRLFLAMELIEGRTLHHHIASKRTLGLAMACEVIEQLCRGLAAAHASGIVHRDIKPSNVMLGERDGDLRVVLLDFGLAKLLDPDEPVITVKHLALGTPATISPEQILGRAIDERTDVYGAGVVAFAMLAGRFPYNSDEPGGRLRMHLTAPVPAVSEHADVPAAVDYVIRTAMAKNPADRYPDALSLCAAFRSAAAV